MNQLEQKITAFVQNDFDALVSLRREFHRHPELGRQESWTAARIEEELDKLGLPHHRAAGTGIVAWLDGTGEGPAITDEKGRSRCMALRADIDALPLTEQHESVYKSEFPGRMHACGHDVHLTSLLGAARVLTAYRSFFSGRIILVFQPDEEHGYGGRQMVSEGAVGGATRCFGFHIAPEFLRGTLALMPGVNNASIDWFRMTFQGKGSHVASPQKGADALFMAAQFVTEAQALVTRLNDPTNPPLIGFGKLNAGTAYNIVADQASLEGTIRTLDPEQRERTKKQLEQLLQQTASLFGGSAFAEWVDNGNMLINTEEAVKEARQVAAALFGEDCLVPRRPSMVGDDMAEIIDAVSGCYAFIGTQDPARPETANPLHHVCLDVDEEVFKVSVPLIAAYALEYMRGEV